MKVGDIVSISWRNDNERYVVIGKGSAQGWWLQNLEDGSLPFADGGFRAKELVNVGQYLPEKIKGK